MSRSRKRRKLKKDPILDFATVFEESGLTFEELTLKMGLDTSERGNVYNQIYVSKNPTWETIKRLCEGLECNIEDVIIHEA